MNIITTKEQLGELVTFYSTVDEFSFDVETVGENRIQPVVNDVLWISLATHGRVDVIPMGHPNGEFSHWEKPILLRGLRKQELGQPLIDTDYSSSESRWTARFFNPQIQLFPKDVFNSLRPLFFSNKLKIGHNIKFDLKSIAKYYNGAVPPTPYFDTMMAAFVIDNRNRGHLKLNDCAKKFLGITIVKGVGAQVEIHSFSDVAKYSALDSEATFALWKVLSPQLTGTLSRVWKLEMDLIPALCDMELTGATIDEQELKNLKVRLDADIDLIKAKAWKLAGVEFSLNSVAEKQRILFGTPEEGGRGLRPNQSINIALTPTGKAAAQAGKQIMYSHYSVSSDALSFFRKKDPLVEAILEYQDLNKLLSTYVIPYIGGIVTHINLGKTTSLSKQGLLLSGKVHTNFKSHGTDTGRFSSSDPNLQNIPSSGKYGKLIRNMFIAPEGHKLIMADYSQIEPRIIAGLSRDPMMLDNYATGGDIYTTTGDALGLDRKAGKVLVLAISYGIGPVQIAQQIGCSTSEAKELLLTFNKKFDTFARYRAHVVRLARNEAVPFVSTVFGRRRYIPELKSHDMGEKSRAERQAFNTIIQGSAADLMKLAIIRAHSCFIDEPGVNVILTVHDELVTVARDDLAEEAAVAIRTSMEGIKLPNIDVPLIVGLEIVDKWGEAKK